MRPVVLLALLVLSACGGRGARNGSDGAGGASSAVDGACWPVRALRLDALEHGSEWEPMSAVEADGQIVHLAKGRRPMGRLVNDQLLAASGKVIGACNDHHEIVFDGTTSKARFDAEGAFVENEVRILVADDGVVHMTSRGKTIFGPGGKGQARVVGPVSEARRTAALLVLLSLGGPPS
ncbi:MAG: hypothetical protein IPJ34_41275 [Myxococcales bacterium]|nr:hypothetical protein [Myxococcales bacterium]